MGVDSKHLIHKQSFKLFYSRSGDGAKLQNTLSKIFWRDLLPLIEKLFNELVQDDFVISIDKLDIDLGIIKKNSLEKDLPDLIIKKLKEKIEKEILSNNLETKKYPTEKGVFFQWLYFLENGLLPWNSVQLSSKDFEKNVLAYLSTNSTAVIEFSELVRKKDLVKVRLTKQYEDDFLKSILNAQFGENFDQIIKILEEWKLFFNNYSSNISCNSFGEIRDYIWQTIFICSIVNGIANKPGPLCVLANVYSINNFINEDIVIIEVLKFCKSNNCAGLLFVFERILSGDFKYQIPTEIKINPQLISLFKMLNERFEIRGLKNHPYPYGMVKDQKSISEHKFANQIPSKNIDSNNPEALEIKNESNNNYDNLGKIDKNLSSVGKSKKNENFRDKEKHEFNIEKLKFGEEEKKKKNEIANTDLELGNTIIEEINLGNFIEKSGKNNLGDNSKNKVKELKKGRALDSKENATLEDDKMETVDLVSIKPSSKFDPSERGVVLGREDDKLENTVNYSFNYKDGTEIFIKNAGIVLVHPFFSHLFKNVGYLERNKFLDEKCRHRAIHLMHLIATGLDKVPEYELILPKFLCGLPFNIPLDNNDGFLKKEIEEVNNLLLAAIKHWGALGDVSPTAIREGFLQRDGKLFKKSGKWNLHVEKKTVDILLGKLPWGLSMVKLPWMKELLIVEWT